MSAVRAVSVLSIVSAIAAVATGCSGGGSPSTVGTGSSVPTVVQSSVTSSAGASEAASQPATADPAVPADYVEKLSVYTDPDTMREALKLAAPGSIAYTYASHLANVAEAALDGGEPMTDLEIETLNGGASFKSCDDLADEKTCVVFSDFKVNTAGKISDLKVSGKEISGRLTAGNGQSVSSQGARFTFLTAYKSVQSGGLFVTMKVQSGGKSISPNLYSATYRSPDGKQREATAAYGPIELDAKSNALITLVFQGVKVGGKVTLDGCVGSSCNSTFKTVVKVG